jgi:hypothetical protein
MQRFIFEMTLFHLSMINGNSMYSTGTSLVRHTELGQLPWKVLNVYIQKSKIHHGQFYEDIDHTEAGNLQ